MLPLASQAALEGLTMLKTRLLLLTTLAVAGGCSPTARTDAPPPAQTATRSAALTVGNGGNLNGGNLNGGNLNGGNLNGGDLNGTDLSQFLVSVRYAGARIEGTPVSQLRLEGTRLVGNVGSSERSGYDFEDASFIGNLGDGTPIPLQVQAIQPGPDGNTDLLEYWVEFLGSDDQWHPACRDYTGAAVWAIPLAGRWDYSIGTSTGGARIDDPDAFTFACMGGAIAKCTLFGYRPWTEVSGTSLAPYHQACTRLLRADFCGTGTPHTQNGNRVNLYDPLGIQQDTEHWVFEANWDEHGARCIFPFNRSHEGNPCVDGALDFTCGLQPDPGALLRDETPTGGSTP
jgi:hypothetical protein